MGHQNSRANRSTGRGSTGERDLPRTPGREVHSPAYRGEQPWRLGGWEVRRQLQAPTHQLLAEPCGQHPFPGWGPRGRTAGVASSELPHKHVPRWSGPWVDRSPSPRHRPQVGSRPSRAALPALPSGALGQCLGLPACWAWNCWVLPGKPGGRLQWPGPPRPPGPAGRPEQRPCTGLALPPRRPQEAVTSTWWRGAGPGHSLRVQEPWESSPPPSTHLKEAHRPVAPAGSRPRWTRGHSLALPPGQP